jgi:LPS-assembly lipoprotein
MIRAVSLWLSLAAVVFATVLGGCGFHLRTWDLEGNVGTARITANARNPVAGPLAQALQSAGVELQGEPDVIIELLEDQTGRRSVSVTDQARAAEYETSLRVRYAIRDGNGETLLQPTWLGASRIYEVDRANLVGSSQEQALLQREMVNDLVQQIIRGLDTVTRSAPSVPDQSGEGAASSVEAASSSEGGAP